MSLPSGNVGVNYGMVGDNLPPHNEVIQMFEDNNIGSMRIYEPVAAVLEGLRNTGIGLDVGPALESLATDCSAAGVWLEEHVVPYVGEVNFLYIAVGNEVIPRELGQFVLPAMEAMHDALTNAGLQGDIKVSTAVDAGVMGNSYPPSAGAFTSEAADYMGPILDFLKEHDSPLLFNVYPYFAYSGNPDVISLDYALFESTGTVVTDGEYKYSNLFDAMVDAMYASMAGMGASDVRIVVSETGWPSDGGTETSIANAQKYNTNLIKHVGCGTPRRPEPIETYLFAMFKENQKEPEVEKHWGLFYPDKEPVYEITF